jgi:hypothetical protein
MSWIVVAVQIIGGVVLFALAVAAADMGTRIVCAVFFAMWCIDVRLQSLTHEAVALRLTLERELQEVRASAARDSKSLAALASRSPPATDLE